MTTPSLNKIAQIQSELNTLAVDYKFLRFTELELQKQYTVIKLNSIMGKYGRRVTVFLDIGMLTLPARYAEVLTDEKIELINENKGKMVITLKGVKQYHNGITSPQYELNVQ